MSSHSFTLEESLLDSICSLLEKAASEPKKNLLGPGKGKVGVSNDAKSIPQKRLVEQLIIDAFWASCKKEEERNLTFRVALRSPSDAAGSFEFKQHIKFDINSLVKLCLAVDSSRYVIGVTDSKEHGDLRIWGFEPRFQPKQWSPFGPTHGETGLVLHADRPGRLIVKNEGATFCIIEGKETIFIDSSHLNRIAKPWTMLYPNDRSHEGPFALLHIVSEINSLHHGGTLIVAPETSSWRQALYGPIRYEGKNGVDFAKQIYDEICAERASTSKDGWFKYMLAVANKDNQVFRQALRVIAQLSAVDGAIIISPEFRILGFGASIQSKSEPTLKIISLKQNEPTRDEPFAFLHGNRHSSAARFAMEVQDSIVFVVSQDGEISLMMAGPTKQQVSVYRHVEYLL